MAMLLCLNCRWMDAAPAPLPSMCVATDRRSIWNVACSTPASNARSASRASVSRPIISITIAAIIIVQDWQKIHLRSTGWLVFATLFGIPLGLLLLTSSHQQMAKMTLAIVLLAFSAYSLFGRTPLHLKTDNWMWLFGCGFFAIF